MKRALLVCVTIMLLFALALPALAAPGEKVDICHRTGSESNGWVAISVSANAWKAHERHGDSLAGEPVPGLPGHEFDEDCNPQESSFAGCFALTNALFGITGASNPYEMAGKPAYSNAECTDQVNVWSFWVWAVWAETEAEAELICNGIEIVTDTPTPNLWLGRECAP